MHHNMMSDHESSVDAVNTVRAALPTVPRELMNVRTSQTAPHHVVSDRAQILPDARRSGLHKQSKRGRIGHALQSDHTGAAAHWKPDAEDATLQGLS